MQIVSKMNEECATVYCSATCQLPLAGMGSPSNRPLPERVPEILDLSAEKVPVKFAVMLVAVKPS